MLKAEHKNLTNQHILVVYVNLPTVGSDIGYCWLQVTPALWLLCVLLLETA